MNTWSCAKRRSNAPWHSCWKCQRGPKKEQDQGENLACITINMAVSTSYEEEYEAIKCSTSKSVSIPPRNTGIPEELSPKPVLKRQENDLAMGKGHSGYRST